MSDCQYWIDVLAGVFVVGAFAYLALKIALGAHVNRLIGAGVDEKRLPEVSAWNPLAHLRTFWYVYGAPRSDIPSAVLYLIVVALRVTIIPTFVAGIFLFLMTAASSRDPAACWSWLP